MKNFQYFLLGLIVFTTNLQSQNFAAPQLNPFSLTNNAARPSPSFTDIDNDDDLDLFTGIVSGDFGFFEHIGFPNFPSFGSFTTNPFNISAIGGNATPFPVDLDNDGDFDMFSGGTGGLRYFENIGTNKVASFGPEVQSPFSIISPSGIAKPYLIDIDNDNDMDIFVGATDGNTYYYENTGNANNPSFAASIMNPFNLKNVGSRSAPAFADLDKDGDLDALIGAKDGSLNYFENIGTVNNPNFKSIGANPFNLKNTGQDAKPFFADLDDDGDADLMVGIGFGDYYYFENITKGTGIDKIKKGNINIYPNPFKEFTTIHLMGNISNDLKLAVTDVFGRIVYIIPEITSNKIIITRQQIGSGIFFVFLTNGNENVFIGKLLVE
jgi:large repetitive protein